LQYPTFTIQCIPNNRTHTITIPLVANDPKGQPTVIILAIVSQQHRWLIAVCNQQIQITVIVIISASGSSTNFFSGNKGCFLALLFAEQG
jgi:hypothetical protein